MGASDLAAWASLAVSLIALAVAFLAIRRGDNNSSAALLVTFNENFRSSWQRILHSDESDRQFELAELMNLVEIACLIQREKSIHGRAAKLLDDYIKQAVGHVLHNQSLASEIPSLFQDETTFENITYFLSQHSDIRSKFDRLRFPDPHHGAAPKLSH